MKYSLTYPELLNIKNPDGGTDTGGSQEWYQDRWRKMSGCGPTAASNLIWYMAQLRDELRLLCNVGDGSRSFFLELMNVMFEHITPGMGGVNNSAIFTQGITRYGAEHGQTLAPSALEIPGMPHKRPHIDSVRDFVGTALQSGSPVAFLNLSNGTLSELENWHWVTIIALETDTMSVDISDQGRVLSIDLAKWLKTSILGGALVYLTIP